VGGREGLFVLVALGNRLFKRIRVAKGKVDLGEHILVREHILRFFKRTRVAKGKADLSERKERV
jgi:hypothetical protein